MNVEHIEWIAANVDDIPPEELIELVTHHDWRVRHPAESHLSRNLDNVEIMDAVIAGIVHENPRIRVACAQLMDHGGDDRCAEPLRQALNDPVPKVRLAALHSLQCQPCKREPLRYDAISDMVQMADHDPDPKVRRSALGGVQVAPDRRLVHAIERALEREPGLGEENRAPKLLQHHLHACTLEELMERVERVAPPRIRQAAAVNLQRHEPSTEAAARLQPLVASEENEILRRCLERGWRHHAGG